MTEENAQSAASADEASAKKGGSQFIMKMIFLGLIVLAIVFYVRSLDHDTPTAESTAGEPAPAGVAPGPAPAATQIAPSAMPPPAAVPPPPAVQPSPGQAPPAAPQVVAPAPVSAPPAVAPETKTVAEPKFRPLTEAEVMRQIQETFAPETLEAPAGR
jgi:hypothetical protein